MKKLLEENETWTQRRRPTAHPPARVLPIYKPKRIGSKSQDYIEFDVECNWYMVVKELINSLVN